MSEVVTVEGGNDTADLARARAHAYLVGDDAPTDPRWEWLRPWQRTIIENLRKCPNVTKACFMANRTSTTSAYKAREENEAFRELWDEALEGCTDIVEEALHDVAVNGHEKITYGKDGSVRSIEKIRDVNAMKFYLSGNRPKTYRETHKLEVEHQLSAGMEEVLRTVRMRRQEANAGSNVRDLPTSEVKTLEIKGGAQDGESCAAAQDHPATR